MAQIAAPVTTAHEIDGGSRLLQFHFEGSHEGIFSHHRHAVTRAGDVDANGEFVGHPGTSLAAASPRRILTLAQRCFTATSVRCSHNYGKASTLCSGLVDPSWLTAPDRRCPMDVYAAG